MTNKIKISRCGFVVIKFKIDHENYFLMRKNPKWNDVNFIGGHVNLRDKSNFERTAKRELLEEVPGLRSFRSFSLEPITDKSDYGPIDSRSAGCQVKYKLQFFLLKFRIIPIPLFKSLSPRSMNRLISENDFLHPPRQGVTGLVSALETLLQGDLESIPYSWDQDIGKILRENNPSWRLQINIPFHN